MSSLRLTFFSQFASTFSEGSKWMDDHGRCPKTRKEGKHMNDLRTTDRRNQALAWGAIFIAVGAVNLIPGAPRGAGLLAIGAILLGLNLTRFRGGIPMNGIRSPSARPVSWSAGFSCFDHRWGSGLRCSSSQPY